MFYLAGFSEDGETNCEERIVSHCYNFLGKVVVAINTNSSFVYNAYLVICMGG